jgi:hypothetical protein
MQTQIAINRLGHENDRVRLSFGVEPMTARRFGVSLTVRRGEALLTIGRLSWLLTWPLAT